MPEPAPSKAPSLSAIPASFFGMHATCIGIGFPLSCSQSNDGWPAVPFGTYRVWDAKVSWPIIEPRRGVFHFGTLDRRIAVLRAHHEQIVMVLGQSPAWATDSRARNNIGVGAPGNPRSIEDWRTYVDAVVKRYAGRIVAYEVWNEPNLPMFWVGTPQQMATLTNVVREETRKYAPKAVVLSPSIAARSPNAPLFTEQYLAAKPSFDVFGMHVYPRPDQTPEASFDLITKFRGILAQHGLHTPIWNTEIAFGASPRQEYRVFYSGQVANALVARAILGSLEFGVARVFWYAWDDHGFGGLYLQRTTANEPTDAGRTWTALYRWLVGAHFDSCTVQGALHQCNFRYADAHAVAVWTTAGTAPVTFTDFKCVARVDGTSTSSSSAATSATTTPVMVVLKGSRGVVSAKAPC